MRRFSQIHTLPLLAGVSLQISDVSRIFLGPVPAIDRLSLQIPAGQFVSILGPSGCGKSTLLRIVAGLDRPNSGGVAFDPPLRKHRIAYVFQDAHLLPWRNVLRNVALPLELAGVAKSQRLDAARGALQAVGLSDSLYRYPAQLSGGMRMRVSLARALVVEPDLLLLDEPFAALDEITRLHLDQQLHRLWRQRKMTTIFVTHSITESVFLSERVIVSSPRPMRVVLDRAIDLPADRPTELRGSPAFAAHSATLLQALHAPVTI